MKSVRSWIRFRPVIPAFIGVSLGFALSMLYIPIVEQQCLYDLEESQVYIMNQRNLKPHHNSMGENHQNTDFVSKSPDKNEHATVAPKPSHFNDGLRPFYIASELGKRDKLLVGVLTSEDHLDSLVLAINNTWAPDLPRVIFFIPYSRDAEFHDKYTKVLGIPVVQLDVDSEEDTAPKLKLSFKMLKYMYEHFSNNYEWFVRTEDTTYMKTDKLLEFVNSVAEMFYQIPEDKRSDILSLIKERRIHRAITLSPLQDSLVFYQVHRHYTELELNRTFIETRMLQTAIKDMLPMLPEGVREKHPSWPIGFPQPFRPTSRFEVIQWEYFNQNVSYGFTEVNPQVELKGAFKRDAIEVFFPMPFSHYDPEIVYRNMKVPDEIHLHRDSGHWDTDTFTLVCFNNKDYKDNRINSDDFLKETQYHPKDFMKVFINSKLHIFRAVDVDLQKKYDEKSCEKSQHNQTECLESKAEAMASRSQLALLLFDKELEQEKRKN
ncbi:hypothetical protein QZH41_004469 [Actinostola sp. cb2023]|nr:hypothetical protein QZH41_004469 [Actinostola sp. cb2023]